MKLKDAFSVVSEWLHLPNAVLIGPTARHFEILQNISLEARATGNLHTDAVLAALAISHSATIASTDRDFRLFAGLKLIDPISGSMK